MRNLPVHELVKTSQAEALEIITEANSKAEQCLQEARQQGEVIQQQAFDEGRQQGFSQGREQGFEEGFAQGQQAGRLEMEDVINKATAKVQMMLMVAEQQAKEMMLDAEKQIVDIALAVSRKIMAYEIAENPMVVLPLVKAALQKVSDQDDVVIRVGIDDFDVVLLAKKELQTIVGSEHALKIIVDSTLGRGSCVIDTSNGSVDARFDIQLETIKKALQDVV